MDTAETPTDNTDRSKSNKSRTAILTGVAITIVATKKIAEALKATQESIALFTGKASNQLNELSEAHSISLGAVAEKNSQKVIQCLKLSPEERSRTEPVIKDSFRTVLSEQWRRSPLSSIALEDQPQLFAIAVIIPFLFAAFLGTTQFPHLLAAGGETALAAVLLFFILLLAHTLILKIFGRRIAVAFGITLAFFFLLGSSPTGPQWARAWFLDLQASLNGLLTMAKGVVTWDRAWMVNWPHAGESASKLLAYAALIWWGSLAIRFWFWYKTFEHIERPPKSQVVIATVIYKLTAITSQLEELDRNQSDSPQYAASQTRSYLVSEVEGIAALIEGPWFRSLKIGHKDSDKELLQLSKEIAHAFRKWKPRLALGGLTNLERAHAAFSLAVLNVCDGDWELLSSQGSSTAHHAPKRILHILLRSISMLATGGLIILSTLYAKVLPAGLSATITTTCTVILIAQLISILDPTSSGRYDSGVKILELAKK